MFLSDRVKIFLFRKFITFNRFKIFVKGIKSCNFVCIMKTNETYYYNDVLNVIALHFLREDMKTKLDRGELNSSSGNFRDLLLCKLK